MVNYKPVCPVCRQSINIRKENFPGVSVAMWNAIQDLFPREVETRKQTSTSSIGSLEAPFMIVETDNPIAQPNGNMNNGLRPITQNEIITAFEVLRRTLSQPGSGFHPMIQDTICHSFEGLRRAISHPNFGFNPIVRKALTFAFEELSGAICQSGGEFHPIIQNAINRALEELGGETSRPDSEISFHVRVALEERLRATSQRPHESSAPPPPPSSSS
ncbi:uncharacterized protein LOC131635117 [Vicia villosa]|uniref:uncharacterized protein LOC131635117 n=1 Tax=Vicia villosa TaxID=3911 RepID=UPI00273BA539|nr:uncharacterized protein LOC131635117 [Vicia villosa]